MDIKEKDADFKNTAELVKAMGIGWNLGNTLDPINSSKAKTDLDYETAWHNVRTTKELISFVKSEGFDTIRLPVTWINHIDPESYKINKPWLDRVREITDWCMDEGFYVILNLHHDEVWINTAQSDYEGVMKRYKALWEQIASEFGDYSHRLIFESMNEVEFKDIGEAKGCELISRINAEFTSLIRNSGKRNADRYLLLAGYRTDIDITCGESGFVLPSDNRITVSLHYYSPSEFAIADKKTSYGYQRTWGTEKDIEYLDGQMKKLKDRFIDKGIPVILGEYGCTLRDKDLDCRKLYLIKVAEYCLKYDICPLLWDNGEEVDRINLRWRTEGLGEALREAKNKYVK